MTDRPSTHGHDCWGWGPKHYECAVREIERLAAQLTAAQQRPVEDGCHCGTCTCNPNMTPAVRFDLSPAQMEGAIRNHLIRLGWTPPGERAQSQAAEVEALRREVEEWQRCAEAQASLHDEAEDCAEELAKALAGLITWFPSADTYRRLGFDPEAPMRALEKARTALGKEGGND